MSTDRIVDGRGLRFVFREAGEASAPAVFLLHSMEYDATDWDGVAEGLAPDYRTIALHQRGFGPSMRMGEYSFELMRDDVVALADVLGIDEFAVIGHGMGGAVGYLLAQESPERVTKLILEDAPMPFGEDVPDPPAPHPDAAFDQAAWEAIARETKYPSPHWWNELPDITSPTLIIAGGSTSYVPQRPMGRVAKLIPDCRREIFEGAGHNVHAARPEEYLALVREFLAA